MALTDNLIAYYKLDGNSNDSVGSNNGSDTDITYAAGNGILVQGAGFNKTTSKIDVGSFGALTDYSISFWVKLTSGQGALLIGLLGSVSVYFSYNHLTSNQLTFVANNGVTDSKIDCGALSNGNWYHIVGTRDSSGNGNVYINADQYFGNVPEVGWNFWIGGYQPAQKWLKDRKGRKLTNEDIEHYQKTIVALFETDKIMKQIDEEITL